MSLSEHFATWCQRRAFRNEVEAASPEEIADCGLTRAQFEKLALMPTEQIARMEEMARINGLDPERLQEDRDLQIEVGLTCASCTEQRRCRSVLAAGASPEQTDFCPNAATYRALAAE